MITRLQVNKIKEFYQDILPKGWVSNFVKDEGGYHISFDYRLFGHECNGMVKLEDPLQELLLNNRLVMGRLSQKNAEIDSLKDKLKRLERKYNALQTSLQSRP